MSDALTSKLLDRETIDRAYPLVRNLVADLTLDRWDRFARRLVCSRASNRPRGFMIVQNAAGYILGLYGFEVRDELQARRTLCVDTIVIASIPGRDAICLAAIRSLEQLARLHGCEAIHAGLDDERHPRNGERSWLAGSFAAAGYSLEAVRACKRMEYNVHHRSAR